MLAPTFKLRLKQFSIVILFIFLFWCSQMTDALAAQPKTCRMGTYITALRDLEPATKAFGADFWLWSVCPSKDLDPIKNIEFVNAVKIEKMYNSVTERKDKTGNFQAQDKVYWTQEKIKATLAHPWDVRNYPFDRHTLKIQLEESTFDTSAFVYAPDLKNSRYRNKMRVEGWRITDFQITPKTSLYESTFGDPELTTGRSEYTGMDIEIKIQRYKVITFLKVTAGVYAAALITLLSFYFTDSGFLSSRIGLLSTAMFATLVNIRGMENILGRTEQLTLVDKIHITTLMYIFCAVAASIYSHWLVERKRAEQALKFDRRLCFPLFTISFAIANGLLIFQAILRG
ncbi:hypothetical protein [Leptolyngbya sp. NIES-2104]|uniref:hypothetical protein n=1 Tax=Leptolyngbya sp. NIES-2104 TaxID=1552121 RepID=UPI0006ECBCF2|nr:hypothetical protein [Leptolyngbya sp. NIES-2104]GAP98319.1 hypothetical protein NIES2104_48740 [Leptolyngbya sp. NIES-2104]